jgi:hypothetical protein
LKFRKEYGKFRKEYGKRRITRQRVQNAFSRLVLFHPVQETVMIKESLMSIAWEISAPKTIIHASIDGTTKDSTWLTQFLSKLSLDIFCSGICSSNASDFATTYALLMF